MRKNMRVKKLFYKASSRWQNKLDMREEMDMKASILSMQRVQNMGSLLQAYSLKKMLETLDYSVSFMDIQKIEEDNCLLEGKTEQFAYECDWKKGILSKIKKVDRYAVNRIKIKKLSNIQNQVLEQFRRDVLEISEGPGEKECDVCVIGSDEVFNCNSASEWGFTSQLFGNVKGAKKVITYAASCGATTYERTSLAIRKKIAETFKGVSALSVRDENTYDFVSNLTDKEVSCHMDPVVVGDFEQEMAKCVIPKDLPERYCIVYSYYNRFHEPKEIQKIKQFCKERKMKLVTVGAPQMWIKKHLVLTPFQALKVFQNADFVITDTFHGTIFSAKYSNRFAVLTRESNKNKLLDLIKKLGLEKHLMESLQQLSDIYELKNNKKKIRDIESVERAKTMQYLKENL